MDKITTKKHKDSNWVGIYLPNGNLFHSVLRRSFPKRSGQGYFYESDRFAFGNSYRSMKAVKEHATNHWNSIQAGQQCFSHD